MKKPSRSLSAVLVLGLVLVFAPAAQHSGNRGGQADSPAAGWRPESKRSWWDRLLGRNGTPKLKDKDLGVAAVPRRDQPVKGKQAKPATRVRELAAERTANSRVFQLSDGRLQRELSVSPMHYRDRAGRWQPIDTAVRPVRRPGFVLGNETSDLRSYFGSGPDRLVHVEASGGGELTLGAPGARPGRPRARMNTVSYEGALGGADLTYEVAPQAVKEKIVLAAPPRRPAVWTFTVRPAGLRAAQRPDGSIAFYRGDFEGPPALVMPKPFMYDSAPDASSPYGRAWSPKVAQSMRWDGRTGLLHVTVRADGGWLTEAARRYPVVVDPTLKIAPTPGQSHDTMILEDEPGTNFDTSWRLSAGTTPTGRARSLLRFPLPPPTELPPGTVIDSAQLQLYWDQNHTANEQPVTIEARRASAPWDETTATWANANNNVGELGTSTAAVDDGDPLQHTIAGAWPYATNADKQFAIGGDYAYNKDATTGDSYTWVPAVAESGTYRVDVHYVSGPDRATSVPYTVHYNGGTKAYTVNQSATSAGGVWKTLGSHPFAAGTSGRIVLGDVGDASKAVVADAVRLVKDGTAVRGAGEEGGYWHSFSVRDVVQSWVNGSPNNGFVVKAQNEAALGQGGPRYEAGITSYNGETATYPKLVVTYGRPGVEVNPPTTIHATGTELSWPAYTDPCGFCPDDDIVEYQVHRSVFQTFTPSAATLVAPVPTNRRTHTDTTARPTPASSTDPFGAAYYYMVAVKTKDGKLTPGPTQIARLPKAGRVTKIFQSGGSVDTTLSSAQPTANHDRLNGQAQLSVGNNSPTYGKTRALLKFPGLTEIPTTAKVQNAELKLWGTDVIGASSAVWELRGLTRDFTETGATWNTANGTTAWTAPGGDFSAVQATGTNYTNDPRRRNLDATALAQWWTAAPSLNQGMIVKLADESATGPQTRALFASSEAAEPQLRPQLVVTYLETTPESTYYTPDTPETLEANSTQPIPLTLTNTTNETWAKNDWVVSYKWTRADGTPVTAPQQRTVLPRDVPSGDTVDVPASVTAPPESIEGNRRVEHVLAWDLYNTRTATWLSGGTAGNAVGALTQRMAVEDSTSDQVGLEKFYAYVGKNTGAGSSLMNNMHAGNAVWQYNAFSNPSRGLATFVRLAYNSKDTSDTVAGYGWSLQASSLMRLGSPIDPHPNTHGRTVSLADGDGTTHTFTLDDKGTSDPADDEYIHPAGVHLYLQRVVECKPNDEVTQAWKMTRPDRTQFFFDCEGYLSAIEDNNGNRMDFTYEVRKSNNKPTKFLRYVTDPAGRQTLTLDYFAKGDNYDYIDDTTWTKKSGTGLTNPHIVDHVKSIRDISNRTLTFAYTDKGLLGELVDGAGTLSKTFKFQYDMTQGNKNVKLVKVTDPRGNATALSYYAPQAGDDPRFHWSLKTVTDRLGNPTTLAYSDPDGSSGQQIQTVVTDAENHATTYLMDAKGRPLRSTNAKNQSTNLVWDDDNNVTRLQEANGAVTTATFDPKTGYPETSKGAEANRNGWAATTFTYQKALGGNIADLTAKRSPEGRLWTFGYSIEGDLTSVTDPAGNATSTAGDYTTTYTYDEWGLLRTARDANGNTTKYDDFHAAGNPQRITDPLSQATLFGYDDRGNVLNVTDALGKKTEQSYDGFGRPTELKRPLDQAKGTFITTPAPIYDGNDNITRKTAPNQAIHEAVYDKADQLIATLAPRDEPAGPERRTSFSYDKVGNIRTETEPNGNLTAAAGDFTTTYAYNEANQLVSVTNAKGDRLGYEYDDVGNVLRIFDPIKSATPDTADFTTTIWYDLDHRVRAVFDALAKAEITDYDRDGLVIAKTDRGGNRTQITLDARGKPVEVRVPRDKTGDTVAYRTTRYEYDQVGNQTKVITPRGLATTDDPDDFVHQTVYDALNRVKELLTPYDKDDALYKTPAKTIYEYDPVGRVRTVSAPPSEAQAVRNDTVYTYFDNGWTKTSRDAWNITTSYEYNPLGQQSKSTLTPAGEPLDSTANRTMRWTYFPDGKLRTRSNDGVPVGSHVVRVDNSDFQNIATSGTWTAASTAGGFEGFNYHTHAAGSGGDAFEWRLNIPRSGSYDVYVKYPAVSGAAASAPYKITHAGGTTDRPVDQTRNSGTWVNVGRYTFTEGGTSKITLSQSPGGTVVADGVRLVRDNTGETDNEFKEFAHQYDANGNLTTLTDNSPNRRIDSFSIGYTQLNQVAKVEEFRTGALRNTTSFTYNPNGAPETTTHDTDYAKYAYDVRNMVSQVTNAGSPTAPSKTTTFTYTDKGERLHQVKGNGNTVDYTYFPDGSVKTQVERRSNGTLVSDHTLTYDLNGNRASDTVATMNADNNTALLSTTSTYTYDPRDRISRVVKTGAGADTETYTHDANDNVLSQVIKGVTSTFHYDRDRLYRTVNWSAGVVADHNYDPFGRLESVSSAGRLIERNVYDGFDRIIENRKLGSLPTTTRYTYDPLDRTTTKTTDAGTVREKTTNYNYLGLTGEVLNEEVAGQITKSYRYSAWGERLSQVKRNSDGTEESAYYGYNPHSDVEQLTDQNGNTKATYGYNAYGGSNDALFTGIDKPEAADPTKEPYNAYRFNAKRWDQGSGTYDMGFRDYSPGLNRFVTRDMYNGALADSKLTLNPFTGNRYAFGSGNPINNIELDGHENDGTSWLSGAIQAAVQRVVQAAGDATDSDPCTPWHPPCAAPDSGGPGSDDVVITQSEGPPLTEQRREQLMEDAADYLRDAEELANIGTGGLCGEGRLWVGAIFGANACVILSSGEASVLVTRELGEGTPYAGLSGSALISNATNANDEDAGITGNAWCVGGDLGTGATVGGEVCIGYSEDWTTPTGVWTASLSGGSGTNMEVHITQTRTREVAALGYEDIGNVLETVTGSSEGWAQVQCLLCFG